MDAPIVEIYDQKGNRVMFSDYIGAVPNPKLASEMFDLNYKIFIKGNRVCKKKYSSVYSDLSKSFNRKKRTK